MNRKLARLLTVPTLIAVILTSTAFGFRPNVYPGISGMSMRFDDDVHNRTDVASGLSTTTFDTLEGTVTVNLPDDLAAGDTISGTVITEPKGKTVDDQAKNQDELSGYVVEVAEQPGPSKKAPVNQIDFCKDPIQKKDDHSTTVCSKWSVPDAVKTVAVVLKNREGKIVSRADVPVSPKGNVAKANDFHFAPAVGQAGKPISVNGPFDGDFKSTAIKLGNQTAKFLASSPRKVVVQNPANSKGPADIEVEYKGKTVAKCSYRSVSVKLAADKLNLTKGAQTTLTVTLAGLIGLLSPVSVQLTNKSPGTVSMGGGETQTVEVDPAQVNGDTYSTKRTLTGVSAGGFSITALVQNGGLSVCSPSGNGGNIPMGPVSQPKPPENPYPNPMPTPTLTPTPTPQATPMTGTFRVTLNGFSVTHVTNRGAFQRPDVLTFRPEVATVDGSGHVSGVIHGGFSTNIGQSPDNPIQGGSSSDNGGFQDGDGYPTRETPWRRTVPVSRFAPGTIPPTGYFEGPLVQNGRAAVIIPSIWTVNSTYGNRDANEDMQFHYFGELLRARADYGLAIANMITHPPAMAINNFLVRGNMLGIRNAATVPFGVPQTRPIGLEAIGREFGFTPQALVLTFESAQFISHTDSGFGVGIVPVHYVDHRSFGGDVTLYFQVERMDTMPPCADNIIGSRLTGTAVLTTSDNRARGPFTSNLNLTVDITDCRGNIQITNFPAIATDPFAIELPSGTVQNVTTVTQTGGGGGTLDRVTGRITIPVTLHFQHSVEGPPARLGGLAGPSDMNLILTTEGTGGHRLSGGSFVLVGSGQFMRGFLGSRMGNLVVTGTISPSP